MNRLAVCILSVPALTLVLASSGKCDDLDKKLRKCLGETAGPCVGSAALTRCLREVDPVSVAILKNTRLSANDRDRALRWRLLAVEALCRDSTEKHPCGGQTVERVGMVLDYTTRPAADLLAAAPRQKAPIVKHYTIAVGRKVVDNLDPTSERKVVFPAMLAYEHDLRTAGSEHTMAKGSVKIGPQPWTLRRGEASVAGGIQLDSDSGKPANQSSVDLVFPVGVLWTWVDKRLLGVESLQLTLKPDFQTDRLWHRHVYTGSVGATLWGPLKAGRKLGGGGLEGYFLPTFQLEVGHVVNAAGNAKLEALKAKGDWSRPAADVPITVDLKLGKRKVTLATEPTLRYDRKDHEWSTYGEEVVSVALDEDEHWSIAASYADGRKPPALAPTSAWLIGLGIKY